MMFFPTKGKEMGAGQSEAMRPKGIIGRQRIYSGSLLDAIRGAKTVEDVEAYLQLGTQPQAVPEDAPVKPPEMRPSPGTVRKWLRAAEERIAYLRSQGEVGAEAQGR